MASRYNKPLLWLVATDKGFLCNGSRCVNYCQSPAVWQLKQFKRFGEKTKDKLFNRYADKRMFSVAVYDGDTVRWAGDGFEVVHPNGTTTDFAIPKPY